MQTVLVSTMPLVLALVVLAAGICKAELAGSPSAAPPATSSAPPPPRAVTTKPTRAALSAPARLTEKAPDSYRVKFTTSKGEFTIEVNRVWAPNGADRFYNLVKNGYYDGTRFFRAIKGFMVQFGIHGSPQTNQAWRDARIKDDPVKASNQRGFITFAKAGPDTRTTQVFINFADNTNLDAMGFPPFGRVISGMNVVDSLYTGYGEGAPGGTGPSQSRIQAEGNAYLEREFPKLDHTKEAKVVLTVEKPRP